MRIKVADLVVELTPIYGLLKSRVAPYAYTGGGEPDIVFDEITENYYRDFNKDCPTLTLEECEYLCTGFYFYEKLLKFNGIMLHSSCVAKDGKAYLFSADCGTGKSTHTHLWLEHLPGAYIVNDDKPALRFVNGRLLAFGSPWSGKTNESNYGGVEVAGIAFLYRGENRIAPLAPAKAIPLFYKQTNRTVYGEFTPLMLEMLDRVLTSVPLYELHCDMSRDAVMTSYNGMKPGGDK